RHSPMSVDSSFFFRLTATTEISTLSLHDALPIFAPSSSSISLWMHCGIVSFSSSCPPMTLQRRFPSRENRRNLSCSSKMKFKTRSEEHTSELQSRGHLVCRLLLEKKKYVILRVYV